MNLGPITGWWVGSSDRGDFWARTGCVKILVFASPTGYMFTSMIWENRQLVTDEPIEFEK